MIWIIFGLFLTIIFGLFAVALIMATANEANWKSCLASLRAQPDLDTVPEEALFAAACKLKIYSCIGALLGLALLFYGISILVL